MPRLLVVHHSPTPTVRVLTDAVVAGAHQHFLDTVVLGAGGGWAQSAPVLEVLGDVGEPQRDAAYDLGGTLAALLEPARA